MSAQIAANSSAMKMPRSASTATDQKYRRYKQLCNAGVAAYLRPAEEGEFGGCERGGDAQVYLRQLQSYDETGLRPATLAEMLRVRRSTISSFSSASAVLNLGRAVEEHLLRNP